MSSLISLILGYLIGSISFGVVLAKYFGLGDLRQIGSGNIGATNVLRTGNKGAAALTLLLDALKGTAAVWIGTLIAGPYMGGFVGMAAFIGHCYPVWLNFKGGKGVATFMGVLLGLSIPAFLVFCLAWLGVAVATRYSSAAALAASAVSLVAAVVTSGFSVGFFLLIMVGLLWWRHRENIERLMAGTESQISLGSNKVGSEK